MRDKELSHGHSGYLQQPLCTHQLQFGTTKDKSKLSHRSLSSLSLSIIDGEHMELPLGWMRDRMALKSQLLNPRLLSALPPKSEIWCLSKTIDTKEPKGKKNTHSLIHDSYDTFFRQMPKSREYFHLTGKFYICSAPRQVTRYSPPVLPHISTAEDLAAQRQQSNQFWEAKRIEQWRKLPPKTRASYTWPTAGLLPKSPATSFQCLAMEDMTEVKSGSNRDSVMSQDGTPNASMSSPSSPSSVTSFRSRWNSTSGSISNIVGDGSDNITSPTSPISLNNKLRNDNPQKILHDIALDNYCLLVFKPLDIVHFESSALPPKRTVSIGPRDPRKRRSLSISPLEYPLTNTYVVCHVPYV